MADAGATGLGLVWGWLAASTEIELRHRARTLALLALATLVVAVVVLLFASPGGVGLFVAGGVAALWLHLAWRREIARAGARALDARDRQRR